MKIDHLFDLSDDVAVVTGAGRGIGEGIARVLAGAGAAVVCAARRRDEIERVADAIRHEGGRAIAIATDVTDAAAVEALAEGAIEAFGHLDVWVNNAGGSPIQAPLTELPREEWDATLRLNLTAIWVCTNAAARHMRDGGRIINISSAAATKPVTAAPIYSMAKAAINNLTHILAAELGPRGVTVNAVAPGFTRTDANAAFRENPELVKAVEAEIALGRFGEPSEIAAVVAFLASDEGHWVTGQTIEASGGYKL